MIHCVIAVLVVVVVVATHLSFIDYERDECTKKKLYITIIVP